MTECADIAITEGKKHPPSGQLHLLGTMRLVNTEGRNITPKGTIRKASLAVLATAPDGQRSRAYLQSIFWQDRAPQQAAASLRNALTKLRTELNPLGDGILITNHQTVTLNTDRLWIDIIAYLDDDAIHKSLPAFGGASVTFLEGLDLRSDQYEEFEDWIRLQRNFWRSRLDAAAIEISSSDTKTIPDPQQVQTVAIGLLGNILSSENHQIHIFANALQDKIALLVKELCAVNIHDLRHDQHTEPASHTELLLRLLD